MIFSIWFFFNEYLERLVERPGRRRRLESPERQNTG
jgi:hypothetical protein